MISVFTVVLRISIYHYRHQVLPFVRLNHFKLFGDLFVDIPPLRFEEAGNLHIEEIGIFHGFKKAEFVGEVFHPVICDPGLLGGCGDGKIQRANLVYQAQSQSVFCAKDPAFGNAVDLIRADLASSHHAGFKFVVSAFGIAFQRGQQLIGIWLQRVDRTGKLAILDGLRSRPSLRPKPVASGSIMITPIEPVKQPESAMILSLAQEI